MIRFFLEHDVALKSAKVAFEEAKEVERLEGLKAEEGGGRRK